MNNKNHKSFLAISFSQGFVSPNIPIATFTQGKKELNFILDTGSDRNIIDKSVLETIEHRIIKNEKDQIVLSGVGGTQETEVCVISFQYENDKFIAEFLAVNLEEAFTSIRKAHAIPIHGMLGSKFLKEHSIVLDFTNMTAYNKKKG